MSKRAMGNTSKLVSGDGLERSTSRQPPKVSCPRCDSNNTKFCYYNNYSRSQPRHFCKSCRRHWTNGGTLRNVPVGGGRKNKKRPKTTHYSSSSTTTNDGGISYISEIVKRQPMWFAPNNTDGLHPPPPPSSSRYLNNSSSSHNTRRSGNILRSFLASLPPVSPLLDPSLSSTYSFLPFARNIEGEVAAGDGYGKVQNSAGNGYYGLGDPSWQKTATTTTKTPLIPTCSFANLTGFEFSSTTGGGGGGGGPVSGTGGTGGYWASCWDELGGFSSFPTCNGFP